MVTGCTFASPFPEPEVIPPGPAPTAQPCRTDEQGVVLCVDFEDDSLAVQAIDRSPYQHHAVAHDVDRTLRLLPDEDAAVLTSVSSLRVAESDELDLSTFTIEMWIYPQQKPPKKQDVGLFDNLGHYSMRLHNDLKIRCGIGLIETTRVSSESAVPERQWSHVACRYTGGEMRVYLNGHLAGCQLLGTTIQGGDLGSAIGSEIDPLLPLVGDGVKDRFLGGIDNVRIYDRALDEDGICVAAGQAPGSCPRECPDSDAGD